MKTEQLLLLCLFSGAVHARAARRDCGVTKTFEAINLCNETYGGTWVECDSGPTATPTFSMPSCSISTSAIPIITASPTIDGPVPGNSTGCSLQSMCIDAGKMCGEGMRRYGTCYDLCTPEAGVLTTPTCFTELPATPTPTPGSLLGNVMLPKDPSPERSQNPECAEKAFLCAPAGW